LFVARITGCQIAKVQGARFRRQHVFPDLGSLEFIEHLTTHAPIHDYTATSRQQFVSVVSEMNAEPGRPPRYAIILKSHLLQQIQGISMPKLKTHKGAAKRFKKTGTGKVMRSHAFGRHILTSKPHKRKKKLHQRVLADPSNQPALKRMIPY
jgi:large subunit ribosomal protein L35